MGRESSIEWTDATWNPSRGCSRVSKGCEHCYAESVARRFSGPGQPYEGLVRLDRDGKARAQWNGVVRMVPEHLADPLRWTRPRRVFVNSMSDIFHEALADEDIDTIFAVMLLAPQHAFQVLTKRPERMREYLSSPSLYERILRAAEPLRADRPELMSVAISDQTRLPAPWIWLGVSVEDQATADERIPHLLACPAAVRFVSYEPALGPVDFHRPYRIAMEEAAGYGLDPTLFRAASGGGLGVQWIIVGGESGPGARPFDLAWARSAVTQCREAGVACFVKQLGAQPIAVPMEGPYPRTTAGGDTWPAQPIRLRDRKGGDMREWPEDLWVRDVPTRGATT